MTTTPNPTAERRIKESLRAAGVIEAGRAMHFKDEPEPVVNAPLGTVVKAVMGLLSEGAPSEEQIELGAAVLFESCDEHVEYSWPEFAEVYPERASSLRSESRRVIEAAGVVPQEPSKVQESSDIDLSAERRSTIDRAKVQDHLYFALRDAGEGRSTSERLASVGTRALCEAYTEGKLT